MDDRRKENESTENITISILMTLLISYLISLVFDFSFYKTFALICILDIYVITKKNNIILEGDN
jgi:predicted membrane metal-binding protein